MIGIPYQKRIVHAELMIEGERRWVCIVRMDNRSGLATVDAGEYVLVGDDFKKLLRTVPIVELEWPVPLIPEPVEEDASGRRRPEHHRGTRQDHERREAARARLCDGADRLTECALCGDLFEPGEVFDDHDCAEVTANEGTAAGGSATFINALDNRWSQL